MQFKVPQKIDIEDRIVGPLTMVQFVYAVVGGGTGYFILNAFPSPVNWVLALPILIFTFCVVFIKVNGRPFGHFLRNGLAYMTSPKTRLWHKGNSNIRVEIYQPVKTQAADPYANKRYSKAQIDKVAEIIDKRGRVGTQ